MERVSFMENAILKSVGSNANVNKDKKFHEPTKLLLFIPSIQDPTTCRLLSP